MSKGFSLRLKPKFNLLSQVYRVVAKIAHGGAVQDARSISSANICRVRIIVTVTRDDCFVSVRNTPNSNEGPGFGRGLFRGGKWGLVQHVGKPLNNGLIASHF